MIRRAATAISLTCLVAAVTSGVAGAVEAQEKAVEESPFAGLAWRNIGPAFMSGRIADVAWDPTDHSVWYVGVGSGGVWKTTNAGTTWTPVFDEQPVYSIGSVAVDPEI